MKLYQNHLIQVSENSWCNSLASTSEIKAAEQALIKQGIPSLELMEKAGEALARYALEIIKSTPLKKIVLLCGPGNNGGDGLVISRILSQHYETIVWLAESENYSPEFLSNLLRIPKHISLKMLGAKIPAALAKYPAIKLSSEADLSKDLIDTVIFDCILGVSAKLPLREHILKLVSAVPKKQLRNSFVIAIDTPTGIDPDTGQAEACAIEAQTTLTVEVLKRGMTQYPARAHCGNIRAIPIGIPVLDTQAEILTEQNLPKINKLFNGHKCNSKLLVIAGSEHMPGAAYLTTQGARGAGLIRAVVTAPQVERILPPEVIRIPQGAHLESYVKDSQAVVLGPGLGPDNLSLVVSTLNACKLYNTPVVVDADALNALASQNLFGLAREITAVFTPHPGESKRLRKERITTSRFDEIDQLSELFAVGEKRCVLLKGAGSIIAGAERSGKVKRGVLINGSPFLSTAGSGDLLSGLIGSLLAQGLTPWEACCLGAFVHARAGEVDRPLFASEFSTRISEQLSTFYKFT